MSEIYGTTNIPGDSVEVRSGGTVGISAAFDTTLGIVGGMDTNNGNATPGDVVTIESSSDAASQFGSNSELKKQVDLAYANGASTIYAVGVTETSTTESFGSTPDGTLGNVPAMDPNVQPEHDITAVDGGANSIDVSIVYDSSVSAPSGPDEINLNPVTGDWKADTSDSYDITYTYGDYSSAITEVAKKLPRSLVVCTENDSVASTLVTELNSYDVDFDFMHGYVGVLPQVSASTYSDSNDDRRLVRVASPRGYTDSAATDEVRTLGAVGGKQSSKALGDSTTYEGLNGLASLRTAYTNSELADFIDEQVYVIKEGGGIKVIKDMTTSTDAKFERVYASEIVDEVTTISHQIAQQFIGQPNTSENRSSIESSHRSSFASLADDNLLNDYAVTASTGANKNEVDVSIGVKVIGIIDIVDITITFGDVIRNGGAT